MCAVTARPTMGAAAADPPTALAVIRWIEPSVYPPLKERSRSRSSALLSAGVSYSARTVRCSRSTVMMRLQPFRAARSAGQTLGALVLGTILAVALSGHAGSYLALFPKHQ
jgi:hypothetical protein